MRVSPNRVEIHLDALAHNLEAVRAHVGPRVAIAAVVKADAYGHGLVEAAKCLEAAGADRLAVAFAGEGAVLRSGGIKRPVMVLCGVGTREEAEAVAEYDLIPVLADSSQAGLLADEARKRERRLRVQLKIDTGMGRLGVPFDKAGAVLAGILDTGVLEPEGLLSHLSSADETDRAYTDEQIRRFKKVLDASGDRIMKASSLANSAGIVGFPEAHLGLVRPGILLYGGLPTPGLRVPFKLRPVMSLKARVLQVRGLPAGTPVSYGRTYYTEGGRRIAVTSAGYSDGVPRALSNRGNVLIQGVKAPIVGRVCMNLTMVDVTGLPGAAAGDEAVFLGVQDGAAITGDDLAEACGTVSYEVFCAIGGSGEKIYAR
ncbi:MAG: alanine racemase [Desulfobacteraceae bacterium]